MCYYIGIEDLAANALIELLDKRGDARRVEFKTLTEYGVAVVKVLNNEKKDAILLLSRDRTLGFIQECSDLFTFDCLDTPDAAIVLKSGFDKNDLIDRFCGSISIPVLRAMSEKEPLQTLLEAVA